MDKKFIRYFKGKKVLITGHTGFKGTWLCILLKFLNAKVFDPPKVEKNSLFEKTKLSKLIDSHNIIDIRNRNKLKKKSHNLNLKS